MGSQFEQTRELIRFKINLSVILGELNENVAKVWVEAFNSLNDNQMIHLMNQIQYLDPATACKITLKYLMDNYYPFRELILYQTDESFKKRMGLENLDNPGSYQN
ncbi:MAG: hypothetical protein D6814_04790 [Calditrichaeota bacterium]|nr:MAG: hypothetical protein D6814_04790 [Calditrichota bacterium]